MKDTIELTRKIMNIDKIPIDEDYTVRQSGDTNTTRTPYNSLRSIPKATTKTTSSINKSSSSNMSDETTSIDMNDLTAVAAAAVAAGSSDSNNINTTATTALIQVLQEEIKKGQQQINTEKAGKRKLFHSLVKVANELQRTKNIMKPLVAEQQYQQQNWYEGGMWRPPTVLPNIRNLDKNNNTTRPILPLNNNNNNNNNNNTNLRFSRRLSRNSFKGETKYGHTFIGGTGSRRGAVSLSDLFFNLVIVTAFTRVGVSISQLGRLDIRSVLYFGIFWTVWNKEASYGTRFDTSDLSATASTLVTCFAVLFASLSVQAPIESVDGTRIMMMAAFVAGLNCLLHIRVAYTSYQQEQDPTLRSPPTFQHPPSSGGSTRPRSDSGATTFSGGGYSSLNQHIINYAVINIIMTFLELTVWTIGIVAFPTNWKYRKYLFGLGFLLAQRIPRAFLANDFHAACSRRGVLFILLLGFLLQSIVVVASEFFEYQTPTYEHYSFIGAACLMFFCIKLLYVDDSGTLTEDHALLVNRLAGFLFNLGQFSLLLSTTVMGSGLNLLTHEYLAATAALPGPAKTLVCGGFSAVLFSTFFIKSMHVKRVPMDPFNQALFIGAYLIQSVVLLLVVGITAAMSAGYTNQFLEKMMQYESILLFVLSGAAFIVVVMGWLDEGVELMLYESAADSLMFRVHPFGIWWCLAPEVTNEEIDGGADELLDGGGEFSSRPSNMRLSVLSPLLGSSIANMKEEFARMGSSGNLNFYQSIRGSGSSLSASNLT